MRVKNRSDLEEFPDGGRATLVRRYSPTLTRKQLDILQSCPYEMPAKFDLRRHPLRLVKMGLLEEDPSARGVFRVTEAGAEVVQRWTVAGLIKPREQTCGACLAHAEYPKSTKPCVVHRLNPL